MERSDLGRRSVSIHGLVRSQEINDLPLTRKILKERSLDMNVVRETAGGLSDHFVVIAEIRDEGKWNSRARANMKGAKKVIKIELSRVASKNLLRKDSGRVEECGEETLDVDEDWIFFRGSYRLREMHVE